MPSASSPHYIHMRIFVTKNIYFQHLMKNSKNKQCGCITWHLLLPVYLKNKCCHSRPEEAFIPANTRRHSSCSKRTESYLASWITSWTAGSDGRGCKASACLSDPRMSWHLTWKLSKLNVALLRGNNNRATQFCVTVTFQLKTERERGKFLPLY